jgi:plastocyanin domain-containing protein
MTLSQVLVTVLGVATVAGIVWFYGFRKDEGIQAAIHAGGYQEATIVLQGGYNPAVIRVVQGQPVRLTFRREETSPCSEGGVVDGFDRHATLPQGASVPIEFLPTETGRLEFHCGMGMLRGAVIVQGP